MNTKVEKRSHEYLESLKRPGVFLITWLQYNTDNICESKIQANNLIAAIQELMQERRDCNTVLKWNKISNGL